eukprot:2189760-Pleurochrysis_carterae.AAC.4
MWVRACGLRSASGRSATGAERRGLQKVTAARRLAECSTTGCAMKAAQTRRESRVEVARRRRPESFGGSVGAMAAGTAATARKFMHEEAVALRGGGARMALRLRLSAARSAPAVRCTRARSADLLVACGTRGGSE